MNILITGGAGSVGRGLTASLLGKGHRVRVLDKQAEAVATLHDDKAELVEGRLEDPQLVREALQGVDAAGPLHHAPCARSLLPASALAGGDG